MTQLSQIYLVMLLITTLSGCTTLGYYSQAVSGHLSLMMSTQPVSELLDAPSTPPALQQKLRVAHDAREFAKDQLALPVGDAFSSYAELGRPWVVVNLVAAPEFSLDAHRWCYPVVGCQAYRGYYQLEKARAEEESFIARGYDTFIAGVTAYSTLGWFDDPLHSGFTALSDNRMVALMFHELAHRVVYISDDTAFNESFATAVELEGLRLWLTQRGDQQGFRKALARLRQRDQTFTLVDAASGRLETLYGQGNRLPEAELRQQKARIFQGLRDDYQTLSAGWDQPGPFGENPAKLNNANLALFSQYNQHVPAFRQLLRDHQGDFRAFYAAVKRLSAQSPRRRQKALARLGQHFHKDF
ncbi:aminopeptidase [Marinobacter orientalis]|uniref:Aminopeptidase n=1 Tax=Marinobacter orientalis TaxID=1928859 RepID=A0A7Y0RA46_9GAMM|nr:aminopeptidase [Marinobacter orientalis]NMT62444.1 aminopeptidase [Marinobacter orientalis]TGX51143.1 zinc protease [Marinobacter orientalis]